MPDFWPEKLQKLSIGDCERVDNVQSVYSAMNAIKKSKDPDISVMRFSIRTVKLRGKYVFRIKNETTKK